MNWLKTFLKVLLIAVTALQITACSKTVQWEEEVLLNTGETIMVNKEVRYSIKGQPGNPADLGYVPDWVETISFKYGGRSYKYTGDAGLMVLAISPRKVPVLLAPPGSKGWDEHHSYPLCAKPNYVQLIPDISGQIWTWPDRIEPWTHNLPSNLLLHRDAPSDIKRRYTMVDKSLQGYMLDPQSSYLQKIDPLRKNQNCHQE